MHTFSPYTRILSYGRCQLKRFPPFALTSLGGPRSSFVRSAVVALDKRVTIGTAELLSPRTLPIIRQTQGLYPARLRSISQNSGAMASGHKITHVLFDMDGLLLNTEEFYTVVQQELCASFGKDFTWDLKAKMMGKKALDAGKVLVSELQLEGVITPEEFIRRREEKLHDLFPTTDLMPGAERLIRHLHKHNIPMAVATSSGLEEGIEGMALSDPFAVCSSHEMHFELKTTKHKEVFALMHHIVVGDDDALKNGKPSPDIFLLAASRFKDPLPAAVHTLVFEDAPIGVQAAVAAGMPVLMVPNPQLDKGLIKEANQVLETLENFDPLAWGLPSFDS